MKGRFLNFLVFSLLCLFGRNLLEAQLFVGLGYQQGFWNMENTKLAVNRFNGQGFLFKSLGQFRWPGGEIYAASYRTEEILLELTLNSRRQRISAESFSGNTLMRRDIRFSLQSLTVSAGPAVVDQDDFAMYLCGSLDFGYMRLLTRLAPKINISRANYSVLRRQQMLAVTAFVRMVFRASRESLLTMSLSPYIQYPLQDFDFTILNQILNPQEWVLDPRPLSGRALNFGLTFTFDLDLLGFLDD